MTQAKIKTMNKFSIAIIVYALGINSLLFQPAHAGILTLDNFSHAQQIVDNGKTPGASSNSLNNLTGTDLHTVTRQFIAEASNGKQAYQTKIDIKPDSGIMAISNDPKSAVLASVFWSFQPIDFTEHGDTLSFDIKQLNLGVNIEFIVNGISSSGIKSFTDAGNVEVSFNDFSQPSQFGNISSLRLNFTGPGSWDGQFGPLSIVNRSTPETIGSVPLPPSFLLMASSLIGLVTIPRSKKS